MIPQINKILYGTDLSKNSAYAFLYAVDMAKRHNASIVILHTIEPIHYIRGQGFLSRRRSEKRQKTGTGDGY